MHVIFIHGQMKAAFRNRFRRAGMENIPLKMVFRVSRYFSYWCSCKGFHRIVSVVQPTTPGKGGLKSAGFPKSCPLKSRKN